MADWKDVTKSITDIFLSNEERLARDKKRKQPITPTQVDRIKSAEGPAAAEKKPDEKPAAGESLSGKLEDNKKALSFAGLSDGGGDRQKTTTTSTVTRSSPYKIDPVIENLLREEMSRPAAPGVSPEEFKTLRERLLSKYEKESDRLGTLDAIQTVANALTRYLAARKGLKEGVNLSNIQVPESKYGEWQKELREDRQADLAELIRAEERSKSEAERAHDRRLRAAGQLADIAARRSSAEQTTTTRETRDEPKKIKEESVSERNARLKQIKDIQKKLQSLRAMKKVQEEEGGTFTERGFNQTYKPLLKDKVFTDSEYKAMMEESDEASYTGYDGDVIGKYINDKIADLNNELESLGGASSETPDPVQAYAEAYGLSYEEAKKWLESQGYGSK